MFDIGFIELVICAVIALLVLGPERLPSAARTAGRWVGGARRMVTQFTSELDRELKADELRKELSKAGDVGLEDVEKTVRGALDEAKRYEDLILSDSDTRKTAPKDRQAAESQPEQATDQINQRESHDTSKPGREPDQPQHEPGDSDQADSRQRLRDWTPPDKPAYDPHAAIQRSGQTDPGGDATDSAGPDTPKDKPEHHS